MESGLSEPASPGNTQAKNKRSHVAPFSSVPLLQPPGLHLFGGEDLLLDAEHEARDDDEDQERDEADSYPQASRTPAGEPGREPLLMQPETERESQDETADTADPHQDIARVCSRAAGTSSGRIMPLMEARNSSP